MAYDLDLISTICSLFKVGLVSVGMYPHQVGHAQPPLGRQGAPRSLERSLGAARCSSSSVPQGGSVRLVYGETMYK